MDTCYVFTGKRGRTRKVMRLVRLYGGDTTRGVITYQRKDCEVERRQMVDDDGQITDYYWLEVVRVQK